MNLGDRISNLVENVCAFAGPPITRVEALKSPPKRALSVVLGDGQHYRSTDGEKSYPRRQRQPGNRGCLLDRRHGNASSLFAGQPLRSDVVIL